MVACRAFLWRLCALEYVAAHHAFPFYGLFAFPHCAFFDLFEKFIEPVHMMLLDLGDFTEMFGDFGEAFLFGNLGRPQVLVYPFGAFLFCRSGQV